MDKKPSKGEYLDILLRSPKTIFSVKDVALLWAEEREQKVSSRLNKYAKAVSTASSVLQTRPSRKSW
jgi:predicted Zn-ribbon and HTH transcriptional regulator